MDRSMQIMNVIHMFESTALILTVITIGKYFEGIRFHMMVRKGETDHSHNVTEDLSIRLVAKNYSLHLPRAKESKVHD